jgi:hypothetical protein
LEPRENGKHITRVSSDEARRLKDETDAARLDAMTDDDIARAVAGDPDSPPLDLDWTQARLSLPPGKDMVTLRISLFRRALCRRFFDQRERQSPRSARPPRRAMEGRCANRPEILPQCRPFWRGRPTVAPVMLIPVRLADGREPFPVLAIYQLLTVPRPGTQPIR